jgi:hypothetical protein
MYTRRLRISHEAARYSDVRADRRHTRVVTESRAGWRGTWVFYVKATNHFKDEVAALKRRVASVQERGIGRIDLQPTLGISISGMNEAVRTVRTTRDINNHSSNSSAVSNNQEALRLVYVLP